MSLNIGGHYPVVTVQSELDGILEDAYKEHYHALLKSVGASYSKAVDAYTNAVLASAGARLRKALPHDRQPPLPGGIYKDLFTGEENKPNPFLQGLNELIYQASRDFPESAWAAKQDARFKFYLGAAIRHSDAEKKKAKELKRFENADSSNQTATAIKWLAIAVAGLAIFVAVLAIALLVK